MTEPATNEAPIPLGAHERGDEALATLPLQPRDDGEPVFREPWEAQAFAMALALHRSGLFSWKEWADTLAAQIAAAQAAGDRDLGDTYYRHWLAALETIVAAKGASTPSDLERHRLAWERAAHRTPHGQPIVLKPADFRD
jgi:nitrile hydratase accessory protein